MLTNNQPEDKSESLKKCKECLRDNVKDYLHCIFCGANLETITSPRKERILFFLTPALIILLATVIFAILKIPNPKVASSALCVKLILSYLLAPALLTVFCYFGKIRPKLSSYWEAGITSVVLVFFSGIFTNLYLNKKLGIIITNLNPREFAMEKATLSFYFIICSIFLSAVSVAIKQSFLKYFMQSSILVKRAVLILPLLLSVSAATLAITSVAGQNAQYRTILKAQVLKDYGLTLQALIILEDELEKYSDNLNIEYLYGVFSLEADFPSGNKEQVLTLLNKANEAHPNSIFTKIYLSQIYKDKKEKDPALKHALQAAELAPTNAFIMDNLGEIYLEFNELERGVEVYKKSLEINPDNPMTMNNLSFTLLNLDQDLVTALQLAKKSVKLLPNQVPNLDTLAWAYYKNKRYTDALETINKIRDHIDYLEEINFHYIMILHSMRLVKNPIELLDKLLASPEVIMDNLLFETISKARAELAYELENE